MTQVVLDAFVGKVESPSERLAALKRLQGLWLRGAGVLGFSALWGLAAGSAHLLLALGDVYKVPMVIALALAVSLPAVFVARHLLRATVSPLDLSSALIASLYRGTLVLLAFAPLLAVYSYTSQWFAPLLAQASALIGVACTGVSFWSRLNRLEGPRAPLWILSGVTTVTLALALLQLISLATPILPLHTAFGAGIDGFVGR